MKTWHGSGQRSMQKQQQGTKQEVFREKPRTEQGSMQKGRKNWVRKHATKGARN